MCQKQKTTIHRNSQLILLPAYLFIILAIAIATQAVTIQEGDVVFNTSLGNQSYTNNLNSTTLNITIEDDSITFQELNYVNEDLGINITQDVPFNDPNTHMNTTRMPFISFEDTFSRNISMFYNNTINATMFFDVDNCFNLSEFNYTSNTTLFNEIIPLINITCSLNRSSAPFELIEQAIPPGAGNIIHSEHKPLEFKNAVVLGLFGIAGILAYAGKKQKFEHDAINHLLYLTALLFSIIGIYAAVLVSLPDNASVNRLVKAWYTATLTVFSVVTFFFMFKVGSRIVLQLREKRPT